MQVVHANPVYDIELLSSHERGLDELESQLEAMLAGTHPRWRAISAIIEEADYHERLLAYVRAWRLDPSTPPLLRKNIGASEELSAREQRFGRLGEVMRYCARVPAHPLAALAHALTATAPIDEMPVDDVG
jgi:hypothetical protein